MTINSPVLICLKDRGTRSKDEGPGEKTKKDETHSKVHRKSDLKSVFNQISPENSFQGLFFEEIFDLTTVFGK